MREFLFYQWSCLSLVGLSSLPHGCGEIGGFRIFGLCFMSFRFIRGRRLSRGIPNFQNLSGMRARGYFLWCRESTILKRWLKWEKVWPCWRDIQRDVHKREGLFRTVFGTINDCFCLQEEAKDTLFPVCWLFRAYFFG